MITIPYSRFYYINKDGIITKNTRIEEYENIAIPNPILQDDTIKILTENSSFKEYDKMKLIIDSFYGIGNYKYYISDTNGKSILDNVVFVIDPVIIDQDTISINNILFKRISGFSKYFISKSSIIYSTTTNKFIRHKLDKPSGYHQVSLINDLGERKSIRVHRYVYFTWKEDLKFSVDIYVNHRDGNKGHNDFYNLEESSPIHNTRHAIDNGLKKQVWSIDEVENVCISLEKYKDLESAYESLETNKSYKTFVNLCYGLRKGRYFKDVASKYNIGNSKTKQKYSEETIRSLCRDFETNSIHKYARSRDYFEYLSKKFDVPYFVVYQVYRRAKWKKISNDYNF